MPAYTFEALDAQGATQKGLIDADTAKAARSQLRARALVPLSVEPALNAPGESSGRGLNITLWGGHVFNATGLAVWTRQLAGLVAAGLPLERALTALAEESEDQRQREYPVARVTRQAKQVVEWKLRAQPAGQIGHQIHRAYPAAEKTSEHDREEEMT